MRPVKVASKSLYETRAGSVCFFVLQRPRYWRLVASLLTHHAHSRVRTLTCFSCFPWIFERLLATETACSLSLTTVGVTRLFSGESKCPPLSSENKFVLRFSNRLKHVFLCVLSSLLLLLSFRSWFHKAGQKHCNNVKQQRESSLNRINFKNKHPSTNQVTRQWWQLVQAAKRTWTQPWSAVVKMMTLLSPFNQWELSVFGEKMSTAALFSSVSTLYPFMSVLCWRTVLSWF